VLELRLAHPLDSGDGGAWRGLWPDVWHDLLAPVLVEPVAAEVQRVELGITGPPL